MGKATAISNLKQQLLRDVSYLSSRSDVLWTSAIVDVVRELQNASIAAVYFGGTLRSLLLARRAGQKKLGRPRDLDIVVEGENFDDVRKNLARQMVRETRFGGLKLQRNSLEFDVWPLERTWALRNKKRERVSFDILPTTTFFNLEAIAVDAWVRPGTARRIYSGDDRFFEGILAETLELNLEANPFPALCVVRSVVMAMSTGFFVGPKLSDYLCRHANKVSDKELDEVQCHHYGERRVHVSDIREALELVAWARLKRRKIRLLRPRHSQLRFEWEDTGNRSVSIHMLRSSYRLSE